MLDFTLALAAQLAPQAPGLRLLRVGRLRSQILLHMTTTQPAGACPYCGTLSRRVHSRYRRTVADLPWGAHRVVLLLYVRKFFCDQPACPQQTFAERLPAVVAPYARRTQRRTATRWRNSGSRASGPNPEVEQRANRRADSAVKITEAPGVWAGTPAAVAPAGVIWAARAGFPACHNG